MSNSPPPPSVPDAPSQRRPPLQLVEVMFDAFFLAIVGIILLMRGAPFGGWLVAKSRGQAYDTGVEWTDGPKIGQAVELFELQGATGWQYAGEWVAGILLAGAAIILLAATALRVRRNRILVASAVPGALSVVAILLAAGVVVQAGFQPIDLLLMALLAGVGTFALFRHKDGGALT